MFLDVLIFIDILIRNTVDIIYSVYVSIELHNTSATSQCVCVINVEESIILLLRDNKIGC